MQVNKRLLLYYGSVDMSSFSKVMGFLVVCLEVNAAGGTVFVCLLCF